MYKSLETMGVVLPMTALLGGSAQQGYLSQASVTLYIYERVGISLGRTNELNGVHVPQEKITDSHFWIF